MNLFVDTSAYYSLLDHKDKNHRNAKRIWDRLMDNDDVLITNNYVLIETTALVQNRLGMGACIDFQDIFVPLTEIYWIEQEIHQASVAALRTANRRKLSLVDCVSFEVCRRYGIDDIFAFDHHFEEQGFTLLTD